MTPCSKFQNSAVPWRTVCVGGLEQCEISDTKNCARGSCHANGYHVNFQFPRKKSTITNKTAQMMFDLQDLVPMKLLVQFVLFRT